MIAIDLKSQRCKDFVAIRDLHHPVSNKDSPHSDLFEILHLIFDSISCLCVQVLNHATYLMQDTPGIPGLLQPAAAAAFFASGNQAPSACV